MTEKEKKNLEELAEEGTRSWGKQLPQFISLTDFETKIKRMARRYGGNDLIYQEGSHRSIIISRSKITWSPRQKGHEDVISSGTFKDIIGGIAEAMGIPCMQLELYFKGGGKPYKRYRREFENRYGL